MAENVKNHNRKEFFLPSLALHPIVHLALHTTLLIIPHDAYLMVSKMGDYQVMRYVLNYLKIVLQPIDYFEAIIFLQKLLNY